MRGCEWISSLEGSIQATDKFSQVPVSAFDNALAMDQMEAAYTTLLKRPIAGGGDIQGSRTGRLAKDGVDHPRILTLGGDHTIVSA